MIYNNFISALKEELEKKPEFSDSLTFAETIKNNGVLRHTLSIRKNNCNISPCIPIDDFFQDYLEGREIEHIAENIIFLYNTYSANFDISLDLSWPMVKDRVFMSLVNRRSNARVLNDTPHLPLLDWAIIFKLEAQMKSRNGYITINKNLFESFNISFAELVRHGYINISKTKPMVLRIMDIVDSYLDNINTDAINDIWIITNEEKQFGSGAILCPETYDFFERENLTDCYIVPSSIHEFMAVRHNTVHDVEGLTEILGLVNESPYVTKTEYLGSNVFTYKELQNELYAELEKVGITPEVLMHHQLL